jgi:hypothetical protein
MKFYLRVINPVIALVVFVLCFWAATKSDHSFNVFGIVVGGMSTYFFAKGIFTSLSLLILGRILLEILYYSDKTNNPVLKRDEIIYSVSFSVFTIGALIGLFLLSTSDNLSKKDVKIENPKDLIISDVYRIKESDRLKFSGKITNLKESTWKEIEVTGKLFINGKLSDEKYKTIPLLPTKSNDDFIIEFNEFNNSNVPDSVRMDCLINAIKNK